MTNDKYFQEKLEKSMRAYESIEASPQLKDKILSTDSQVIENAGEGAAGVWSERRRASKKKYVRFGGLAAACLVIVMGITMIFGGEDHLYVQNQVFGENTIVTVQQQDPSPKAGGRGMEIDPAVGGPDSSFVQVSVESHEPCLITAEEGTLTFIREDYVKIIDMYPAQVEGGDPFIWTVALQADNESLENNGFSLIIKYEKKSVILILEQGSEEGQWTVREGQ